MDGQLEKKSLEFELIGLSYLLCQIVIWALNIVLIINLILM